LDTEPSVLIVDSSDDTREVLQTALQHRGCRTYTAGRAQAGLELARRYRPDLIVLDLELDESGGDELSGRFAEQSRTYGIPLVMLGSIRERLGGRRPHAAGASPTSLPEGELVPKPYHYGPLVRRIEELLGVPLA
jgi:two-component system response regulator AdeR